MNNKTSLSNIFINDINILDTYNYKYVKTITST